MSHRSLWQEAPLPRFAPLAEPGEFDVVVIGAGITGLTAAYLLKQVGKRVCVLERGRLGSGETGRTSAHLTTVTDLRLTDLAKTFGDESAIRVWEGGESAIELVQSLVTTLGIDCGFQRVPAFLCGKFAAEENRTVDDDAKSLREDCDTARRLGLAAEFLPHGPILGRPAVRFDNQAVFQPLEYLAGLASQIPGDGSEIHEESEVVRVESKPRIVTANGHEIRCRDVVVATHVPLMALKGLASATLLQSKLYPYSSYVLGGWIPKGTLAPGLYDDTADPYYYLRIHNAGDHDYAVFGGEDHKTGQEKDSRVCYERLEAMFRRILPAVEIDHRWSGQVVETNDGLPYIGETAAGQFEGTGYSGNGLTFGTLAGRMARDAVLGHSNPWQKLLSPARISIRGGLWDYLVENVDYPRYLLESWWSSDDRARSLDDIPVGEGRVVAIDGKQAACFRNSEGELQAVSAVCTHLGCAVHWNRAEQTWDCPCHGSRFLPSGEVLGGPAETPLEPVALPAETRAALHQAH